MPRPRAMHQCPANGCGRRVPADRLMCPPHWFTVPQALRDAVWAAYRGPGPGSAEHVDAIGAAVEAVNAKLAAE